MENKKERLYGMAIVSEDYVGGKDLPLDGFEGIVIFDSKRFYVIEGYYSKGYYKTKDLGQLSYEKLYKSDNAKDLAEQIKSECIKLFNNEEGKTKHTENYEENDEDFLYRFPDIAIDESIEFFIRSKEPGVPLITPTMQSDWKKMRSCTEWE